MIRFIRGKYLYYDGASVVVETKGGVGYRIFIPETSPLLNNREGDEISVNTYLQVKEDGMLLYGFHDVDSLELFEKLITVKGVGPKAGLSIMALAETEVIKHYIASKDSSFIARASGIGKKIAERVILELGDKIDLIDEDMIIDGEGKPSSINKALNSEREEAIIALTTLGYSKEEARYAIMKVQEEDLRAEEYIKNGLKYLI